MIREPTEIPAEEDFAALRRQCALLSAVKGDDLEAMVRQSFVYLVGAGETVLEPSESVERAHFLISGELAELTTRDWGEERIVKTIGPGGVVGEIELLSGDTALAGVRALRDSRLLSVERSVLERLAAAYPEVVRGITELARQRTGRFLMIRHISRLFGGGGDKLEDPLLRLQAEEDWLNFEADILSQLERQVEWTRIDRGAALFSEGDAPDGAYVLVSGLLSVQRKGESGEPLEFARIHHGEIVGELGLIVNAVRSATVVALRDCELFRIAPEVFAEVSQRYPRRMINLHQSITERFYRHVSARPFRPAVSNIAIMPSSDDEGILDFCRTLQQRLVRKSSFRLLTSRIIDEMLGHPGIARSPEGDFDHARLMQALNNVESGNRRMIYAGDAGWNHWNSRCVRQSDRVMVIADSNTVPDLSSIREKQPDAAQSWHLVLVHPADTHRPSHTHAWLEDDRISSVYHVRRGNESDLGRLTRIISGKSVGLVLGGGGARGFAHLGVLRALEELGITVDMVGATSIGAPIAGWLAQGKDAEQCISAARRAFQRLIDITLPRTSIISGRRITSVIENETAAWDIEDFWLPFFCVSTSITSFRAHVHRRGNSARAIRASVSIPGVLPPVPEGDELLVDGGVINNLPIDIMRRMNPSGPILAIDVVAPRGLRASHDYGLSVSGWKQFFGSLLRRKTRDQAPPIASVIMQAMMVGSNHTREKLLSDSVADFYLNIHVKDIGLLQFDAVDHAIELGYQQSRLTLAEWVRNSTDFKRQ